MTLYSKAFIECLYCHYDDRLQDPKLPIGIRSLFQERQAQLAEQYYRFCSPPLLQTPQAPAPVPPLPWYKQILTKFF
jgi:hypothetical protein